MGSVSGERTNWGQTLNARHVKPAAVRLGFVANGDRFGWHSFRHSLSTFVNDHTSDITVSQTLLRHANPNITMIYTHGEFDKALNAQRQYMAAMTSKTVAA
jgi:site-specific recombinase XerC